MRTLAALILVAAVAGTALHANDWPDFRGPGRTGLWQESGILSRFPDTGIKVLWRTPIKGGYAGPVVADGRVFVTDFTPIRGLRGTERVLALEERTGRILWTREWDADYRGVTQNQTGPSATPTVDGDRVYVQGLAGALLCLSVKTGEIVWQKNYVKDFGVDVEQWPWFYGYTASPLVEGRFLIAVVSAPPNAKVIAFDKLTGKEAWRAPGGDTAITPDWGPGTGWPMVVSAGGVRQLIFWHPQAVISLAPETGRTYWEQPFKSHGDGVGGGPVWDGSTMIFSTAFNGTLAMKLDPTLPMATMLWKGKTDSEIQTDGLHTWFSPPVMQDGHIYGICSYGQLRCLRADTGERVWETQAVLKERARWTGAYIVLNGNRAFINNDRGELIIARLNPQGYQEVSRTQLIKPTTPPGNRRELGVVNRTFPAYANRHVYTRNDEEIICASLAAEDGAPAPK